MIRFDTIVFPTDFSPCAAAAQRYAVQIARECRAKLYIIHVIPKISFLDAADVFHIRMPEMTAEMKDAARKPPDALVSPKDREGLDVETVLLHGVPYREIVDFAREKSADVIVIATHGRTGLEYLLLGGTTDKVIRQAPCPVLSVKHPDMDRVMP